MTTAAEVESTKYQLQVARSLIAMQGLTVAEVAERTGIQQDNLEAFLIGVTAALSPRSSISLFRYLGVEEGGLSADIVHFWKIGVGRMNNARQLMPLATVIPLIENHSAMALKPKNGIVPVLIKSGEVRVVLYVKVPRLHNVNVSDLGLTPGTFQGHNKVHSVPDYYYELIFTGALRPSYFDLILEGDYINESIEVLRIVALEHDITISQLVGMVVEKAQANRIEASKASTATEVTAEVVSLLAHEKGGVVSPMYQQEVVPAEETSRIIVAGGRH